MSQNWQQRILNHEEIPPKGVWESIAGKLDNDNWQSRLFEHEEMPPSGLWENIAGKLDEAAPVISIQKNSNKKIYRMIAAAASVIAIALLAVFFLNQKKVIGNNNIAATETKKTGEAVAPLVKANDTVEQQNITAATSPAKEKIITKTKKTTAVEETTIPEIAYVKNNETAPVAGPPVLNKNQKLTNSLGETTNDISLMSSPNNYISITGPNGESVRVSSKFSSVINYLNDKAPSAEEYLDKVIKEGTLWRGKFKTWRDKMINNSLAPSPENFMNIIELSSVVKEK